MKKLDSTTLTSIAAEKAGMSYGNYVALYGVVTEEDPEIIAEALPNVPLCVECGKPILHRAGRQKYCSDECMRRAGRRRCVERYRKRRKEEAGERICEVCGKPIPSERNLQSKTCSERCARKRREQTKSQYRIVHHVPVLAGTERICPICGTSFTPVVHNQKYCCKECSAKANYDFSRKNKRAKKELRKHA